MVPTKPQFPELGLTYGQKQTPWPQNDLRLLTPGRGGRLRGPRRTPLSHGAPLTSEPRAASVLCHPVGSRDCPWGPPCRPQRQRQSSPCVTVFIELPPNARGEMTQPSGGGQGGSLRIPTGSVVSPMLSPVTTCCHGRPNSPVGAASCPTSVPQRCVPSNRLGAQPGNLPWPLGRNSNLKGPQLSPVPSPSPTMRAHSGSLPERSLRAAGRGAKAGSRKHPGLAAPSRQPRSPDTCINTLRPLSPAQSSRPAWPTCPLVGR